MHFKKLSETKAKEEHTFLATGAMELCVYSTFLTLHETLKFAMPFYYFLDTIKKQFTEHLR
jgi:hypothetical protein